MNFSSQTAEITSRALCIFVCDAGRPSDLNCPAIGLCLVYECMRVVLYEIQLNERKNVYIVHKANYTVAK